MFSLRIVTTNHYQAKPIPGLDTTHSEFRNTPVQRVPVLRIFGSTPAGQKTCMHIHGVFPYLYVPYDGTKPVDRYLRQFAASLDKALNVASRNTNSNFQHVYKISLVSGIPMYGYHPEEEYFLKIYLFNPTSIRRAADLLLGGAVMNKPFQPHESHLPYALQLFIDYNLYGMNLLNAAALKFRKRAKDEKCASKGVKKKKNSPLMETHDSSLLKVSSPGSLSSSSSSSPVDRVWHEDTISSDLWLPADVERQSTCELEVDVVAADILNRHELASNVGANPGLTALWEDEKQRRRDAGDSSQLESDSSQERDCVLPSASEKELVARFLNIVKHQQMLRSSQSDESLSSQPSYPASQVENHVSPADNIGGSQNTVMVSDSDDGEGRVEKVEAEYAPIVNMNSIERVVSCSQSFSRTTSQKDMPDSQDRSVVDILAALLEESGPPPSQLASLEDQDSILNQSIILDKEGEQEEEEESILMTQFINEDPTGATTTSLVQLDEPWDDDTDNDIVMNTDDSDDEVNLLPQFDGASDKVPDSHVKSDPGPVPSTTSSQSAGTSQGAGVTSQNPAADTSGVNRTDVNWRAGTAGRAVGSTQGFPSGSGSWTQQGWSQQTGTSSGTWHGQSPSWSHQQNYQNWPQQQMPSATFSSQQAPFHSSSPATTFQSPPHNPYASPTHQQAYQTPSPSASHHQYQYPSYQSPAPSQSYQQPYQSPSQHPYQSPAASQTFHSPQSYHSSSSTAPYQSPSGQPFSPSAAAGQPYQMPASSKTYASSPGSQPYQSPTASQPYQSPQGSSGYQSASGQLYPSPYQSPSQSHHSSPQQPYPLPYQSPVPGVRYSSQSSWCAQGYPGYYQGLAGSHVTGSSGKHSASTGSTQSLQPDPTFGQTCNSSSSGLNSFPAQDLQQHQQTCSGSLKQIQTEVNILNKLPSSHLVAGSETQSAAPQPSKRKGGRKAKVVAEVCEFKSPQPPCLSPTSVASKNHFESGPFMSCLQSSSNTPQVASGAGFSHTKLQDYGDSANVNTVDGSKSAMSSRESETLLATKISTLEFKPNIAQFSVGPVSTELPTSKCMAPLDQDQSSSLALKGEASTTTPMIQQLLMEEPVRMNIRKEDREAVMKKPTPNSTPKPRKKYTRRTDQGVRKPGRPRSTSLSAPAHLPLGYCGYPQPVMSLPTACRQDKSHTASISFNGESSMPSPMQNYAWQQHWKQQNFQVGSQWQQQQQQPQQQQWAMNDWQSYNSLGEGGGGGELDINSIPATSRVHQRSLSADTIHSPIFEHNAHPGQLPPFSADHLTMQDNSASIEPPDVHRDSINDKSSLSSLFQLVSDVGSEDIDWENTSSAVVPNLFPNSSESETPKSTPSSDVNQGSPLVKDFITLEAPCKQVFDITDKANSDTTGMTSSEESDRTDLDFSSDLQPRTLNRSHSLGSSHPRLGKQSRLKKLGLHRSTDLGCVSGPVESNPSYTYTFHVPTPVFKKLKFFRSAESRKHNINVVRMHPMDARRYSLLKIGREIVKAVKLTEVDLAIHNVSLPSPYPFVFADGSTNRVNLDIPVVSVDRRSGDSGSEESSLSKFDTDFPPNKVAPPSFFNAGQVSASLTRSSSTAPRGSPVSSDWLRQYTGQQSANYNGRFSPGMQAAYSPQHAGISPQRSNFPFAQQQRDGRVNSFSGHQHMPQNSLNRHFSSQPPEDTSGLAFQQLSHKGNSFYPQSTPASTQLQGNYYTHQQDAYMNQNQTSVTQQQSYYQQQYQQQQYQLQQQFAQQQTQTSLNSSNPEPKNGLRSPGQHGLISKIDSGSVLGHSADQEPECDNNATETSPFNTRVNAQRRDIHAEHMASCAAPQNANVYTTLNPQIVGSTDDNTHSDSHIHLNSQILEPEDEHSFGNQMNDTFLQNRILSSHCPKQLRRLSLRKSGKYNGNPLQVENAFSLNEFPDSNGDQIMANHCQIHETSEHVNDIPSVSMQDAYSKHLHSNASITAGRGRQRERTSWRKNVKALSLKMPMPHSDQSNGGINGIHDSLQYSDVHSATSSHKESDIDDNDIREDFSPSSSSSRLTRLVDNASAPTESGRSPRQAKLRSIYSKNRYNLKPKKKRKRQKRLIEGIHYIVVGKFRGHQVMLVKVKKLHLNPTESVRADLFEELAAKEIVRVVSPSRNVEYRVSGKELQAKSYHNYTDGETNAKTEDMQFHLYNNTPFNQHANSVPQTCHRPSRGRSLRHGRFRSAHTLIKNQEVALVTPKGNEAESKNVLAGLISGNVRGNSISEARENLRNCCQFMYDNFFLLFKERFSKCKKAKESLSSSKYECFKDNFFENVRSSSFCSFQQKFLANIQKLKSSDYSSSSDDEDDVLDDAVLKAKLGMPYMLLTCARSKFHLFKSVKNGSTRSGQSLFIRKPVVNGKASVMPWWCEDIQPNKLEAIDSIQGKHCRDVEEQSMNSTVLHSDEEKALSPSSEFCLDENSNPQDAVEAVSKALLMSETIHVKSDSVLKEKSNNLHMSQETDLDKSGFHNYSILVNTSLCSDNMKMQEEKDDYLKSQMAFFEDISSDSHSSDTIIMGNFVAGENSSEDEELPLQDCPSAMCKSMPSTYVVASSEPCVPSIDILPSSNKDSPCEDSSGASSAALMGLDMEQTELSGNFEDNSDKTNDTVTDSPLHKNIQVCTAEHGQQVLSEMDKSVSPTNALETHASQTEASGDGVFLTQASCESVMLTQALDESELLTQASDETVLLTETLARHVAETLESAPQQSAFVEEDFSLRRQGNDLELPGTKTGVLYESDDDATIELDMNHDISSKVSSNEVFEQFPLSQAKESAGNKSLDKSIDSDNDLDSSVSVNSSDRPKKHGKGMKKSRRDKGSNLVNRRQLMDDDNSSSNDELNSVTENDTLSHNKHLRQRKQTLYTYYTDICDSSGDFSDSSDEDFNSRASHRKGSKSNRKHKGDAQNRKLHQISMDFGKAARSGHRARPTRGKKKKSPGGDKLLNSLSLLHMATLANLTETQAEGQSVASMAIDNVHSQSLQYSNLATSDHNTTFTPSLEHMSFISPHNSDAFVVSPPVACSPTDKNRWQQTRESNPRADEIAVSRRLLNSQRLARLKPGCNGASNLGSKPLPFSRLINNSASPIPSNFSFIHISDSSLRPEPVIQCEDAGTSNNTLQLLETRRAQVNCASFSMKDILRLTTPDDSMDSDSKDSAALIRPPEPKRAQVKSTSLSMSDILKLTSVDKGTDLDNSQSSYSLLSLLANPGPCSDLSSNKTVEMSSQHTSLHGCQQQPAECRSASNNVPHSTSFMNPVAEIHDKLSETSSPPLPQASDVSTSPSIPLSEASQLPTSVDRSDTQGLKNLQVEFSQLVKDSCSDTEMDSGLTSPSQTLFGISACGTEQPALAKCPALSAASVSEINSHECGSEVKMKCYEKAKLRRHKKHKHHERKRSKKGIIHYHSVVDQTTTGSPAPITVNVENNLDARPSTERLLPGSPVQSTVSDTSVSENPTHSLLQTQPSPSVEQQVRIGQAGKHGADKVVSANAASSLLLTVRTEDPVADCRELAKSHKIIQAQTSPQTNINGTPVSTVLEIPKISKARDKTSMFDRFYCAHPKNITCREDKSDTSLKIKDLEQMLKPLHPLQIPAYPFIAHSFEPQLGQSCHHSLSSCLCFPYCWQWPVHTPGSDPAASPLNLCTVEKSPNNYCPVAPVSPMSPSYQSHAQAVTLSGVSPPIKKAKPLWYPWLTVESFANRSDANANIIQQNHNSDVNKAENKVNVSHDFPINTSYLEPNHESATRENTCKAPTIREAQNKKANTSIPSKTLRRSSSRNIDLVARTLLEANKARMNAERLSSCQTVSELLGNVIEAEYEQGSSTVITSADSVSRPVLTASSKMSHGVDTKHSLIYRRGIEQKYGAAADLHKKEDAALLGVTSTSELNIKCSRQFSEEIHDKIVRKFTENTNSLGTDSYNAAVCKPEQHCQQITDNTQACNFGFSSVLKHADNVLTGLGDKIVTKLIQGDLGYLLSEPAEASKGKKFPNSSSSQKRSSTEDKSSEDRKDPPPEKTDASEQPDNRSEIGSGCKDKKRQEVAESENAQDITVCPLKGAPSRGAIEETLLTLGLPCVQPPVAFCTDPEDLPDRPMEHGGRVLKVESKRLSELSPFITSQHIIGIKIWRSHTLSSSKLLASQSQGRPLRDRLEQDPQMQFLLTGEQLIVVSPACTPPIRSSVQTWLQNKMVDTRETKPVDNTPQMSQSYGSCIAVEAITDDKHKQFEHKCSFNIPTQNSEQISIDLCRQIKTDVIKLDDSIDETVPSETTVLEVDSSACVDTDLDVSCTPSNTTPVRLVSSVQRSIPPLSTPSFAESQEPSLTNSRPAARVQRKRSLRFSDDCARHVPEVSSPTESHTLDEHYKKTKRRALEAQTYKQEIPRTSYHSLSSTPVKESMQGPPDIVCTPVRSPQECAKQSSQDTARDAPGVAHKRAADPEVPILRHISTSTESSLSKTILTSQTQRQVSDPGVNDVSQIEGPTPRNSFGFKVAQTHMQDSKALHKYQYVTAFSMELHVETRGDLKPDPEFDAVKALFYSVLNDIPPEKGTRNITGVVVVDLDSWNKISARKGQEQIPGTALNSSNMPVLSGCATSSAVVPEQLPPGSALSSTPPPSCAPSQGTSSAQGNSSTSLPNPQAPQPSPSLQFSGKGKGKGRPVPVSGNGATTDDALLEKCAVEGMEVSYVRDEMDLMNTITQLMIQFDPDILVGFEIQMLSWGYLLQRAAQLNVDLCSKISRVQDAKSDSHFNAEKDEWGADHMSEIHVAGRIVLNLWRVLRHEITLNVYSFENVAYHVLHQRVPLYSFRSLTKWYGQQTHLHRWRVFEHYFRRVKGQLDIIDQLDLIGKTSEFARVFGIEFYDVLARGSQIRVESMMLRLAKPMNFVPVSPGVNQRARQKAAECIPLNLEPESKYYTSPVAVLDFQSLYPSIMIAYNYCFTTCLGRLDSLEKAHEGAFEFGCTSLNLTPAVLKKIRDFVTVSPNGVAFLKSSVRRGVLPIMVEEILNTRLMVKKSMKAYKNDKILSRMLDARQLGLKLIANVTYGYTGASFSGRMPCIEVGDSIVRKARESLERAIELVRSTPRWGGHVVYGDTDSMFIHFPGRSKDEAFVLGQEIADAVTAMFPKPMKLRFEKIYLPCVLQTKKRYVGFMYETQDQTQPVYDAKGIETVRRDACSAVSKVLERSIKVLFSTHDLSRVKHYVTRQLHKLLEGKVSVIDLIFAKEYRGMMGYKPGACIPSLEIARRRLRLDRRSEPRVGERVPYVIVHGSPGLPLIQLVREPSELVADTSLRLNATYYITKQILPPLDRLFSLIGISVFKWYLDMPKVVRVGPVMGPTVSNKQGTISQFFATNNCPVCDAQTKLSVCDRCRKDPQLVTFMLTTRIRDWERTCNKLTQVCAACQGTQDSEQACVSIDCPIMFRRIIANSDLVRADNLQETLTKYLQF